MPLTRKETSAPPSCGLMAGQSPVPLAGVSVEAELKDFASRVVMTQRYRNDGEKPIEAVYVFPLDEGVAVCGFEVLVGTVHVVGHVEEREKAYETYDDAIASGHGAYLLDQDRPDVFTASIGNVPPGTEVVVRITSVAELQAEGDGIRFVLPTTVSPRYAPAEDRRGVGRTPAEMLNPPVAFQVPYGLKLAVRLEMPSAILSVESPSHPIALELDGANGTVRLGGRETTLDRDFVLTVRLAEPARPRAWVELLPDGTAAALIAFQPRFEPGSPPAHGEVVFLVDRSGSMGGTSIAEARNALQLCLRSLTPGLLFNIVGFGSTHQKLFPESRVYDDASLAEASRYVSALDADLGGTEILEALKAVLGVPASGPRQLFVLTDGEVTNTEAVLSLVRSQAGTTRVFTFGIGAGASLHLVKGMARAGAGTAELIAPGERLEAKVMRQLSKALSPALGDVRVDWGDLEVTQAPHQVPPVFEGGRLLVYGFLKARGAGTVRLRAEGPAGPVEQAVSIDTTEAPAGTLVAALAARTLIRDLEEGTSPLHDRRGSLQGRATKDHVKDELVRLGTTYGLVSRETSFVAVEKRETPVSGEMALRRIPIALTSGWGRLGEGSVTGMLTMTGHPVFAAGVAACAPLYDLASPLQASQGPVGAPRRPFRDRADTKVARRLPSQAKSKIEGAGLLSSLKKVLVSPPATRLSPPSPPPAPGRERAGVSVRPLDRLVGLQKADGSWELSDTLLEILGRAQEELQPPEVTGAEAATLARIWATALALAWLESRATSERDEWELLARKARTWLAERGLQEPATGTWEGAARAALDPVRTP